MATNYTTKTAALKATKADMRQVQVSKKIEIGSTDTKTIIEDGSVSAEDLLVSVEGKDERQSVKTLIKDVSDKVDNMKMGIDIGTDSSESPEDDPESGVTNAPAAFNAVSKLNFRGSYVTVVEDPVTKEVTLWINKSTAYPEYDTVTPFDMDTADKDGGSSVVTSQALTTTAVKLFTPPADNAYTCTSGTNVNAVLGKDGSNTNFGKTFYKLRTADGLETFRVSSTQALFIRTTYNGTSGDWKKIDFGTKAGRTHTIGQGYADGVTASPFSGSSYATIGTASDALYVRYSVQPFTSAQAPDGRVPNTSEAEVKMIVNWDALLTLDGGAATLEYAFAPNTTTDLTTLTPVKLVDKFFTEYKVATVGSLDCSYVSKQNSDAVSGIVYATAGTTVKVNAANIQNTQWKASNQNDTRLVIDAASSSSDVTAKVADCALTSGSATGSDAVYSYTMSGTITAGSKNNAGQLTITATPWSTSAGTPKTDTTLKGFWGDITKNDASSNNTQATTREVWAKETYRALNIDGTGTWDATTDVTGISLTVNGEATQGAVAQYGYLKHPADAKKDGSTQDYPSASTTVKASYVRKFSGIGATSGFKLTGNNFTSAGVKVYWYEASNSKLVELTNIGNSNNSVSATTLSHSYNLATESATTAPVIIFVIPQGVTIGTVTCAAL